MTSLNPTFTIGYQLIEALRLHRSVDKETARRKALAVLDRVGVSAARTRLKQYPHELSGGLRQRVMIAMALMCDPVLLVADEPTTALDVTIQAQVLELLESLKQDLGMAILMITHDLGVVAEYCQRVVVMYSGRVVETADVGPLFATPKHPYTRGLINSIPKLESSVSLLPTIPGVVPTASARPDGCYFSTRCERVTMQCQNKPELQILPTSESHKQHPHSYACWNPIP
jgi:oligopeptide/dipeptide ABC transporter ATP-binding protein